jgi:hypothetical protein
MDILEIARLIMDAFGPCTNVYECYTPHEIVAEMQEPGETILGWIEGQLDVEDILQDRYFGTLEGDRHARAVKSWDEHRAAIVTRLRGIGYHVG